MDEMKKHLGLFLKVGGGGAAVLVSSLAALYFTQNKLIYHPSLPGLPKSPKENPYGLRSPSDMGLPFETVEITTSDQVKLRGWFLKQKESQSSPTLIFFHENAGNIGTRLSYLKSYYTDVGVNILIVAYRGYSDSEGSPSQEGLEKDSIAILKHAFERKDIDLKMIFTHGRSLGGATSISAVTLGLHPVAGVILENTFSSIGDVVKDMLPYFSIFSKLILKNPWNTKLLIPKVTQPILFIKSLKDELVKTEQMNTLQNQATASQYKEEYVIPEGDHNGNWLIDPQEYFSRIKSFIAKCVDIQNKKGSL